MVIGTYGAGLFIMQIFNAQFSKTVVILCIGSFLLLIELLWFSNLVRYEFNKAPLSIQAMGTLLEYSGQEHEDGKKRSAEYAIKVWPDEGLPIIPGYSDIKKLLQQAIIILNYEDYEQLSNDNKTMLAEVMQGAGSDISRRINDDAIIDFTNHSSHTIEDILRNASLTQRYIGSVRYAWGNKNITLYYTIKRSSTSEEYRVYCVSVQDNIDKLLVISNLLPGLAVLAFTLVSLALYMALQYIQTQQLQASYAELEKTTQAYQRFVPSGFLRLLGHKNIIDVQLGDNASLDLAVLFTDIRSFTTLAETMSAQETFRFINSFLNQMAPILRNNKGIIDSYMGDAIMAIFPHSKESSVHAAVGMLKRLKEYNSGRERAGFPPIDIGIGINFGPVELGTVGDQTRMQNTVLSDSVNVASRVEGLTKILGCQLLITDEVVRQLNTDHPFLLRYVGELPVKGRSSSIRLYEVFNADSDTLRLAKQKYKPQFAEALEAYLSENINEAEALFRSIIEKTPEDAVARYYLQAAQKQLRLTPPKLEVSKN